MPATIVTGSRADQYTISLTVDDVDYGTWDKFDGGAVDSDQTTYKPAGAPKLSLGGPADVGAITLGRIYDKDRDHAKVHDLIGKVGRGKCVVTKQPLDLDGNAWDKPLTYTGILKSVTPPPTDSTKADPAMIEVEVAPGGTVS